MATTPALKITISAALPVADLQPETIAKASAAVREIVTAMADKKFVGTDARVRVGNIRIPGNG